MDAEGIETRHNQHKMTTEELLNKNGIIRYGGRLIYCEKNHFYYKGVPYPSLLKVQQKIDKIPAKGGRTIHTDTMDKKVGPVDKYPLE